MTTTIISLRGICQRLNGVKSLKGRRKFLSIVIINVIINMVTIPLIELINARLVVCWKEPNRGLDADLSWFIEDCNMAALRDHIRLNDRYLWTDDISSIVPPALLPISSIGSMALSWTAKSIMFYMDIHNSELAKLAEDSRADHQRYSNDITLRCNGQLLKWTPYLMCCQSWSGPLMDRISPMNMSTEQARKRRRRAGWF